MKTLLALILTTTLANANNVTCIQEMGVINCTNGITGADYGYAQQYRNPNGDSVTVWNNNINRYQEVPAISPIQPIAPIPSLRVLEPFK